ncbi:hypothetical protein J19TS2_54460 [Cohnella xylanilytica]|nr:hypothetical protein J19TS2_54460 [Cohnella xylanilytica]
MLVGAGADLFGWRAGVLALGAASLGCSIAFWLRLPESSNGRPRSRPFFGSWLIGLRTSFSSRRLLALYAMGFSLMGVYVAIFNYIGYALNVTPYSIGQTALGLLFVVNLVGTWSSVLFGRLAARRSRRFALVLATLIALGGIALAGLDSLAAKVVGCGAVAFGFFAGHAVASGWVGLLAPGQAKESAPAVYLLFYYAGSSIVGWTGGIVLRQYGWDGLVGAGFVLLASTLATTYPLLRTAFSTSPAAVGEPAHTNSPTHSRRT